jgi:Zn-dependent M28 family amino/carboxypeptidase
MDSTAKRTEPYIASEHPAPGADDDASGIAATLAIARYLSNFKGRLRHTVRFCFFNAEEMGLKGSRNYAMTIRAVDAPIKSVICMDMISYNKGSPTIKSFEIHAGYTDPAVRDISVPIAVLVKDCAKNLHELDDAQIYKGLKPDETANDTDLNKFDGAIGRSDHTAFHEHAYPALVVTEDAFIGPPGQPPDFNQNYHSFKDNASNIDSAYGAAITHAVALALKALAGGR